MRQIGQVKLSDGVLNVKIPNGQYSGFYVCYKPTAAAAVTLVRSDYGNVRLVWNNTDMINISAENFSLLNSQYGGVAEFTPVIAALSRMTIYIPCGQFYDSENIYDVASNDDVYFQLEFPELASAAKVASGNIVIYAVPAVGQMNYLYRLTTRQEIASGAETRTGVISIKNATQLFMKSPTTLLNKIQISKNKETVIDATIADLLAKSEYEHIIETTVGDMIIELESSRVLSNMIGGDLEYNLEFSAAGTQTIVVGHFEYPTTKRATSKQRANEQLVHKISQVNS